MITEEQILHKLDNYKHGWYCRFIDLGHPYVYLIDSRLNVFKGTNDRWAIVVEKLGFSPSGGRIELEIFYFGNCLTNLESYNGQEINHYTSMPIPVDELYNTIDVNYLKSDARFWTIRGQKVELSHKNQDYLDAGIELNEYEPGEISAEEVGRLLITTHQDLFRATDDELYKCIPNDLEKILVLDEWYHRDFNEIHQPETSNEQLRMSYDMVADKLPMDFDSFVKMFREQQLSNSIFNQKQWDDNRPSSYETWQLLAKVIATGDPSLYKPTLKPNSHWKNWPESGSL